MKGFNGGNLRETKFKAESRRNREGTEKYRQTCTQ